MASLFGISAGLLIVIMVWSLIWKGIALWISARKNSKVWFVIMLIVNTIGILEILYIFIFSKMGGKKSATKPAPKTKRKKK